MNGLFTVLVVLIILAAVCLVIAVLLQNGKGEGLTTNFAAANQTLGVRGAANLLEKVTWGLVAFILVLSIVTAFVVRGGASGGIDITNDIENVQQAEQPAFPTAPIEQGAPEE